MLDAENMILTRCIIVRVMLAKNLGLFLGGNCQSHCQELDFPAFYELLLEIRELIGLGKKNMISWDHVAFEQTNIVSIYSNYTKIIILDDYTYLVELIMIILSRDWSMRLIQN